MVKGQIELETEYGNIKGISRTARPYMRQEEMEEDPAQNEAMIEGASKKTESLDMMRQEPGQSHSVANNKQDKEPLANLTSLSEGTTRMKEEKGQNLNKKEITS